MTSAEIPSTFETKFIEVVELMLQQQIAADARREMADHEQLDRLQRLQAQLQELAERVDSMAAIGSAPTKPAIDLSAPVRAVEKSSGRGTAQPSGALSEWERQKQLLMQGLDISEDSQPAPPPEPPPAAPENAPNEVKQVEPAVTEPNSHDWLEHLDPNDPALSDEGERKNLVAKLRKLEVELSLERATIARDRSELDAQLNELRRAERQQANESAGDGASKSKEQGKVDRMLRFLGRKP